MSATQASPASLVMPLHDVPQSLILTKDALRRRRLPWSPDLFDQLRHGGPPTEEQPTSHNRIWG
eukprot:3609019-Rhodomonas_salina.6